MAKERAARGLPQKFIKDAVLVERDGCLDWPYALDTKGYGHINIRGKHKRVHRIVCRKVHGKPPSRKHDAAHSCNNRRCCNKRHLRWATRADNLADRIQHGTANRGERHGLVKLTVESVRFCRSNQRRFKKTELAARFGVGETAIRNCISGETWGWLK